MKNIFSKSEDSGKKSRRASSKKGTRVNWEAIFAGVALLLNMYQAWDSNNDANTRNKRDSTQTAILTKTFEQGQKETERIRKRDATQIALLSKSNIQLANEFKRLKDRDFKQTKLLVESNQISKNQYELATMNKMAYFQIDCGIADSKPQQQNPPYHIFSPSINLTNVGGGVAQKINVSFFVLSIDRYQDKFIVSKLYDRNYTYKIGINESKTISSASVEIPYKTRHHMDSLRRANTKLPVGNIQFTHLLVLRIRSINVSLSKTIEQFFVRAYNGDFSYPVFIPNTESPFNREMMYTFRPTYDTIDYSILEIPAKKYGFNFEELRRQVGGKYKYEDAYSY